MFDPTTFTGFHTWLSLIGLASGLVVAAALLRGHAKPGWTGVYLSTAIATSATGFGFPFDAILPAHIIGAVSLVLLGVAAFALYGRRLEGGWRRTYAIAAMLGVYLLAFVTVAQMFLKIPALHALAPTQAEPPFAIAQGLLLLAFVAWTWMAARRFSAGPHRTA